MSYHVPEHVPLPTALPTPTPCRTDGPLTLEEERLAGQLMKRKLNSTRSSTVSLTTGGTVCRIYYIHRKLENILSLHL